MEYTVFDLVRGPETYERLSWEQRAAFDVEWQVALGVARLDPDLEPLMALVLHWWVLAGGEESRAAWTRAHYEERMRPATREGWYSRESLFARTAAGVLAAFSGAAERGEWLLAWDRECGEAAVSRDWHGLWVLIADGYASAHLTDEDIARARAGAGPARV